MRELHGVPEVHAITLDHFGPKLVPEVNNGDHVSVRVADSADPTDQLRTSTVHPILLLHRIRKHWHDTEKLENIRGCLVQG